MRILANYVLKQGRENYGSESFCITVEAELDMSISMIADTADALFAEARDAVKRQIEGNKANTPANVTPINADEVYHS